jgi:hypothetical protein
MQHEPFLCPVSPLTIYEHSDEVPETRYELHVTTGNLTSDVEAKSSPLKTYVVTGGLIPKVCNFCSGNVLKCNITILQPCKVQIIFQFYDDNY